MATVGDVAEFSPDGTRLGNWPGLSQVPITSSIVGDFVYSVSDPSTRTPLLRETGPNFTYSPLFNAAPETAPVTFDNNVMLTRDLHGDRRREAVPITTDTLSGSGHAAVARTGRWHSCCNAHDRHRLADDLRARSHRPRRRHGHYETITAPMGYLVNGPEFVINDDALAVMSSTTTGGVTVSYYPFD